MGSFDAVIFDLDGTLLDTSKGIFFTANQTARELGFPECHDRELFELFIGPPLHVGFSLVFSLEGQELQRASDKYIELYAINGGDGLYEYYPGLVDALFRLKSNGIRLGVSTLKNENVASRMLRGSAYGDIFDSIHGSDDAESLSKSDIVAMTLSDLGTGNRTLVVGDSESDLKGAHSNSLPFLAVSWGFGFRDGYGEGTAVVSDADMLCRYVMGGN